VAKDLPYLPTYKNVGALFEKIEKAKVPDVFTVRFLTDTIGLKGTGDRQLITLLKKLGFLDSAGKPTPEYNRLKNKSTAKAAIADGIKIAYAPLYEANEDAHNLPNDELKGLIAQVSGTEETMTRLITGTFNALGKSADFKAITSAADDPSESDEGKSEENANTNKKEDKLPKESEKSQSKFNPDFRFNIEIHLPSNGTEETYLAIFSALRKSLG